MFQIKTDIRQYNCETRKKVEKLIRNWVIRPSDLIFDKESGEWNPIGQHPAFDQLFRQLEEQESKMADTVVTADRPGAGEEEDSEVTQMTEHPTRDDSEASADAEDNQPPEPGEDVEGVARDSDEITMMTDKTLDMLRVEGRSEEEGDASEADASADDIEDEPGDEETTGVVERDDVERDEDTDAVDRDGVQKDEETNIVGRDELDGTSDEATPDEATQLIDQSEIGADDDAPPPEEKKDEANGKGRHGLPEDIFVTNELPSDSVEDSVLDELGELGDGEDFDLDEGLSEDEEETDVEAKAAAASGEEGDDASDDSEETESEERGESAPAEPLDDEQEGERKAKWRIVMSEDEDDVDEEWERVEDEMRDTDEFSKEELDASIEADVDEPQDDLEFDDADESLEEIDDVEELEPEEAGLGDEDSEDLDGLLDDAADLVGVARENAPDAVDADAADADAADPGRDPIETPVGEMDDPVFVSEGYNMELPVDVGPSKEDLAAGIPTSNVSEEVKEKTFAYPEPKRPGEVQMRTFGLGEHVVEENASAGVSQEADADVDPFEDTGPLEKRARDEQTPDSSPEETSAPAIEQPPRDHSVIIVIGLLITFIGALLIAVYFLG